MKLITQTDNAGARFGEQTAIKMICEAGFDAIDYSMFLMKDHSDYVLNTPSYRSHLKELKDIAASYNVTFEQAHAPFPSAKNDDPVYNAEIMEKLKRSIECAGLLGVKIIVVHPVNFKENKFEKNMEIYHTLEPVAREYGVKIAVENMFGRDKTGKIFPTVCSLADEFNQYVDALNPEYFTACLDLGHCGLVGQNAAQMIRDMGSRIGCFHIHDNDLVDDNHTLPYTRKMNFDSILKAMADIGYNGHFTFEADNFLKAFPDDLVPDALCFMEKTGRSMIKKIEEYKKA